jgi:hypothetical protein
VRYEEECAPAAPEAVGDNPQAEIERQSERWYQLGEQYRAEQRELDELALVKGRKADLYFGAASAIVSDSSNVKAAKR